jgi:peptidoglycan hydrolase-like protein with peptidoglycan-binding domain
MAATLEPLPAPALCAGPSRKPEVRLEAVEDLDIPSRVQLSTGRTDQFFVLGVNPSMSCVPPTRRASRGAARTRVVHGLLVAALGGLGLAAIPAVPVSASPVVAQAPLAPTIVGMGEGARGNDVKTVQSALLAAGVPVPGGADGIFGPKTKSALTAFQSRKGLAATGRVDGPTAAALGLAQAATAPAASPGTGGLVLGARGPAVAELQRALMATGVYVLGGADGIFGPATRAAVSNFQRFNQLPVTGEVDATTASRLKLGSTPAAAPTAPTPPAAPTPPPAAPSAPAAPAAAKNSGFSGMTVGARGDNVRALQRALIAAGISVRGGADGVFGPMTKAALTSYQRAQGLSASGVVDDAVISKLGLGSGAAPAPAPKPAPTPPPSPSAKYVGLKLGSNGDLVKDLQRALMRTGLTLRGGADGVFGNATRSTLILFQRTNATPQTGVVSAKDASVLGLGSATPPPASPAKNPQGVSSPAGFPVFGERGTRVTALQKSLLAAGIKFAGGADGVFGAATSGAIMEFQRRNGLTPTGKVDEATANRLGSAPAPPPPPPSSTGVTIDVFPVQGRCWFGDTWHAPRSGGRLHLGVDIIAPKGKLLYAAVSGTISRMYWDRPGALAGNGLRIQQDDGTYFTYLHLDTFADGIEVGAKVSAGQVVGTVGNTGNSATPHLHFEVHPRGGAAVNPFPLVKAIDACSVTAPRG